MIFLLAELSDHTQYKLGALESWRHPDFKPPSWEVLPSCTLAHDHEGDQSKSKVLVARMSSAASILCVLFGRF